MLGVVFIALILAPLNAASLDEFFPNFVTSNSWNNEFFHEESSKMQLNTPQKLQEWFDKYETVVLGNKFAEVRINGSIAKPNVTSIEDLNSLVQNGASLVWRFERMKVLLSDDDPVKRIGELAEQAIGLPTSAHLYVSGPNTGALAPHTDPYDTLIFHLDGVKHWTVCTPRIQGHADSSDAVKAQLQELKRSTIRGCTSYSQADLAQMDCHEFDAKPGDIIYMPKGLPHVARASGAGPTTHLTLGFQREHLRWIDVASDAIRNALGDVASEDAEVINELINKVTHIKNPLNRDMQVWMFDAVPLWASTNPSQAQQRVAMFWTEPSSSSPTSLVKAQWQKFIQAVTFFQEFLSDHLAAELPAKQTAYGLEQRLKNTLKAAAASVISQGSNMKTTLKARTPLAISNRLSVRRSRRSPLSSCYSQQSCGVLPGMKTSGKITVTESSCDEQCDTKPQTCCRSSCACDGAPRVCDSGCSHTTSCEPDQSCECDVLWAFSCGCDDSAGCDDGWRCDDSCDLTTSCECDNECECSSKTTRPEGATNCDHSCESCNYADCVCEDSLTQRGDTVCCNPKPAHSDWTDAAGNCNFKCQEGYERRPMAGQVLNNGDKDDCCARPDNSEWIAPTTYGDCRWQCSDGFTRNSLVEVYGIHEAHFGCMQCQTCPDGYFQVSACNSTHQTVCGRCSECPDGLVSKASCSGVRDTVCLPEVDVETNDQWAKDQDNKITFFVSFVGVPPSEEIYLELVPVGSGLTISQPIVKFRRSFNHNDDFRFRGSTTVKPTSYGLQEVKVVAKGFFDCPCQPSSDDSQPCKRGCYDADTLWPIPNVRSVVINGDRLPVWDRLGLRYGETPTADQLGEMYQCDNSDVEITYKSSQPWNGDATCGVVTVEAQGVQVPASVAGAQLDGEGGFTPATNNVECNEDPFFAGDIVDFVFSDTMSSILNLLPLPDWFKLDTLGIPVQISDLFSTSFETIRGKDAKTLGACQGLPLRDEGVYQLMTFNRGINLFLNKQNISIENFEDDGVCLLWDMCQPRSAQGGTCDGIPGTIYFGLNKPVIDAMLNSELTSSLSSLGMRASAARLGFGGYHQAFNGEQPWFWNGNGHFQHTEMDVYNFFVGADVELNPADNVNIQLSGDIFAELPMVCGEFREFFGTGGFAGAGTVSGRVTFDASFGLGKLAIATNPYIDFNAKFLASLGGDRVRDQCGIKSNPAGIFLTGTARPGFEPNSLLGHMLRSNMLTATLEGDAMILLRREASPLPSYLFDEISEQIQQLTSAVTQSIGILQADDEKAFFGMVEGLETLIENLKKSGFDLEDANLSIELAKLTIKFTRFTKEAFDAVFALIERGAETLKTSFEDYAASLAAEVIDLYDGIGLRGKFIFCFGLKRCVGWSGEAEVSLTMMRDDNFARCDDRFGLLYKYHMNRYFSDVAFGIANVRAHLDSGHSKDQPGEMAFDGDITTAWNGSTISAILGIEQSLLEPTVYIRTWDMKKLLTIRVYTDCSNADFGCPAELRLERWSGQAGFLDPVVIDIPKQQPAGWTNVSADVPCIEQQRWRVTISHVYVNGSKYHYQQYYELFKETKGHVALHEVILGGESSKQMITGSVALSSGFKLDPWGWLKIRSGISFQYFTSSYPLAKYAQQADLANLKMESFHGVQAEVQTTFLGLDVAAGGIISTNLVMRGDKLVAFNGGSVSAYLTGRIFGIFDATLSASLFLESELQGILVRGEFNTASREEVAEKVHGLLNGIADSADRRLTQAQNALTKAQSGLTKGQQKLEDAKDWLDTKRKVFDDAVAALERAKSKVEAAKRPVIAAQDKLRDAQRKVDSLCRIKTCRDVCMPGLVWVSKWWGGYPKFDSCAWTIKDPICVLANAGCSVLRAAAYGVLKLAEIALYGVLAILDAAKLVLTAAQGAVRVAELAIDAAKLVLTGAQAALEGLKLALEGAKAFLEGVKIAVRFGLNIIAELAKVLISEIFAIRNATFEVEITNKNPFRILINFDITILGFDIDGIGFEFDFSDVASFFKSLAQMFVDTVKRIFSGSRRRRAIEGLLNHPEFHKLDAAFTEILGERLRRFSNESVNATGTTMTYEELLQDSETPPEAPKVAPCDCWGSIKEYLGAVVDVLEAEAEIESEMGLSLDEIANVNASMNSAMEQGSGVTVDPNNAGLKALNITYEQLMESLANQSGDAQLAELMAQYNQATQTQMDAAMQAFQQREWTSVVNQRLSNFTMSCPAIQCQTVEDCVTASLAWVSEQLWFAVESPCATATTTNVTVNTGCLGGSAMADHASALAQIAYSSRESIDHAFANISSAMEAAEQFKQLQTLFDLEQESHFFCAAPPTLLLHPSNVTLDAGTSAHLTCHAQADPEPEYIWTKDGKVIAQGVQERSILIHDASLEDIGVYQCAAGNARGTAFSKEAHVTVVVNKEELLVTIESATSLRQGLSSDQDSLAALLAGDIGLAREQVMDVTYSNNDKRISMIFQPTTAANESAINLRRLLEDSLRSLEKGSFIADLEVPFFVTSWSVDTVDRATVAEDANPGSHIMRLGFNAPRKGVSPKFSFVEPEDVLVVDAETGDISLGSTGAFEEASSEYSTMAQVSWPATFISGSRYWNSVRSIQPNPQCFTSKQDSDLLSKFNQGSIDCAETIAPISKRLQDCDDASPLARYFLRTACLTECGLSSSQCGIKEDICPTTSHLRNIIQRVDPELVEESRVCVHSTINRIQSAGVCLDESVQACDGQRLSWLEDKFMQGSDDCALKHEYIQEARLCKGKQRFNESLFNEVTATCGNGCDCANVPSCTTTNTSYIIAELESNSDTCGAVRSLSKDLNACVDKVKVEEDLLPKLAEIDGACPVVEKPLPLSTLESAALTLSSSNSTCEDIVHFLRNSTACVTPRRFMTSAQLTGLGERCVDKCGAEACFGYEHDKFLIKLSVEDVNDNAPAFTKSVYSFTVKETVPLSAVLGYVEATDLDAGVNALFDYSIKSCSSEAGIKLNPCPIYVDSISGAVIVIDDVSPYVLQKVKLVVDAIDQGTPAQTGSTLVEVLVTDVNNNAPVIDVPAVVTVNEDTAAGSVVATVTATDKDSMDQGKLRFSIKSGNDGTFSINETSGQITLSGVLDTALLASYNLTVSVIDLAGHMDDGLLFIDIKPVEFLRFLGADELEATFDMGFDFAEDGLAKYTVSIPESARFAEDTFLFRLSAGGEGEGNWGSGAVQYQALQTHSSIVIDEYGYVYLKAGTTLDYEKLQQLELALVKAVWNQLQDEDGSPSSVSARIVLRVLNANDNAPVFAKGLDTSLKLLESMAEDTVISRVSATDRDGDSLSYSLENDFNGTFAISSRGEISIEKPLSAGEYHLNVVVSDGFTQIEHSILATVYSGSSIPKASSSSSNSSNGVAIGVGIAVAVGLILLAVFLVRRRSDKAKFAYSQQQLSASNKSAQVTNPVYSSKGQANDNALDSSDSLATVDPIYSVGIAAGEEEPFLENYDNTDASGALQNDAVDHIRAHPKPVVTTSAQQQPVYDEGDVLAGPEDEYTLGSAGPQALYDEGSAGQQPLYDEGSAGQQPLYDEGSAGGEDMYTLGSTPANAQPATQPVYDMGDSTETVESNNLYTLGSADPNSAQVQALYDIGSSQT